jgi:hypothetical protein
MISFDDLQHLYPSQSIKVDGGLNLNNIEYSLKPRLDQEALQREAMQPQQWHESVLRLTASLVAAGKKDDEIHAITSRLTCAPHTVEETRAEVQTMIDGARAKGYGSKLKNTQDRQPNSSSEPLPLLRKFPAPQLYPVNALGDLKVIVEAVQKSTQAPIEIAAASALSATALVVQGHANVETLGGVKPLSLYMLTVARSGERKSSCDAPIIAAIKDFEKAQAKDMEHTFQKQKNRYEIYQAERSKITTLLKAKRGGITRQEAERQLELLGPEPDLPPSTDRIVSEPTFEGLTRMFKEGQPSLGLFSDEGGQFLGGHAMNADNKQKTLAAFNDLWGGNSIRRTRQGDGAYQLHDRRLAIHLMVQPTVAHQLLSDPLAVDTGFLARFLISEPLSTIGTRSHRGSFLDSQRIQDFHNRQRALLEHEMPVNPDTGGLDPRLLKLSPKAREALITFADEVERQQLKGGEYEAITGTASKSAEQATRLAGVLTLWRNFQADVIDASEMQNGIELARYYLNEAKRLVEVAIVSRELQAADNLLKWISERHGKTCFVFSDVLQNGPYGIRDSKRLKKLFAILSEHGWLIKMPNGTIVKGKSCSTAFRLAELADLAEG